LLQRARRHSLCAELLLAGAKHHYQQQGVRAAACSFTCAKKWSKKFVGERRDMVGSVDGELILSFGTLYDDHWHFLYQ
jgi:hypothetical protein